MANDFTETTVWPVNELGEIVLQAGKGTNKITGFIPSGRVPTDVLTNRVCVVVPAPAGTPTYTKETTDQFISGRQDSLAPFTFESIYADNTIYTKALIASTYAAGIPGVMERVVDNTIGGSIAAASGNLYAWKMRCQPTHQVTFGRPRTQIVGNDLKLRTNYRMTLVFKLFQPDTIGWNQKNINQPLAAIFALSQQGGTAPYIYKTGQLATASSPLYLTLKGSTLYPEIRSVSEELGLASDDTGGIGYTQWTFADTVHTACRVDGARVLNGLKYHKIVLDFNLDERRLKDGGGGYFKATFDDKPWIDFHGATSCPAIDGKDLIVPPNPRLGFYEVNGGTQTSGTLNNVVSSCTIERSLMIHTYSIVEA